MRSTQCRQRRARFPLYDLNIAGRPTFWVAAVAGIIVFGSLIGFGAYTWLLRVAPISLVSTYAYVNPVVAVVMGYLLAGEALTPGTLIAAAIIVGSVALTTVANQSRKRPA